MMTVCDRQTLDVILRDMEWYAKVGDEHAAKTAKAIHDSVYRDIAARAATAVVGLGIAFDGDLEAYIDCGADAEQDTQEQVNKWNAEDGDKRYSVVRVRLVKEAP